MDGYRRFFWNKYRPIAGAVPRARIEVCERALEVRPALPPPDPPSASSRHRPATLRRRAIIRPMSHNEEPIQWERDAAPAAWWTARLDDSYDLLTALVPRGFEAYARVFHPVPIEGETLRWSELAARNSRIVHPQMQLSAIGRPPGVDGPTAHCRAPLPIAERRALIEVLRPETLTPAKCWFCHPEQSLRGHDAAPAACVDLPSGGEGYLLYAGPLDLAAAVSLVRVSGADEELALTLQRSDLTEREFAGELIAISAARSASSVVPLGSFPFTDGLPAIWWPEDRAWFVATERTLSTTYVAGTRRAIERLLVSSSLEALEARTTDPLSEMSDDPNAALDTRADRWWVR
jgi:hypothetical protein